MRIALIFLAVAGVALAQSTAASSTEVQRRLIGSIEGKDLFLHHCAACHGADAKGKGPTAAALKTPVPDLTTIAKRNRGAFPDRKVESIIGGEDDVRPAHGSRQMPIWGPVFSQVEWDQNLSKIRVHNLVKYIESLQRK